MTARIIQVAVLCAFLLLWQTLIWRSPGMEFFAGSPIGIFSALTQPDVLERLPRDVFLTVIHAVAGFAIGVGLGTIAGILFWWSGTVHVVFKPYVIFLGSVPIFALGPIFAFWFGTESLSKIVLAAVASFTFAVVQVHRGATTSDQALLRLGKAFGASKFKLLTAIIVPSALVWVLNGCRINISMALLASVIGEFIASRRGVGNLLILAEGLFNINLMLGCVLILGVITIWANAIIRPIENWLAKNELVPSQY